MTTPNNATPKLATFYVNTAARRVRVYHRDKNCRYLRMAVNSSSIKRIRDTEPGLREPLYHVINDQLLTLHACVRCGS